MITLIVMVMLIAYGCIGFYVGCKAAFETIWRSVQGLNKRTIIKRFVRCYWIGMTETLVMALGWLPIWIITRQSPIDVDWWEVK